VRDQHLEFSYAMTDIICAITPLVVVSNSSVDAFEPRLSSARTKQTAVEDDHTNEEERPERTTRTFNLCTPGEASKLFTMLLLLLLLLMMMCAALLTLSVAEHFCASDVECRQL